MSIYTVLGAGNGGQALASHLKNLGNEVRLWSRNATIVSHLKERGNQIEVQGALRFSEKIDVITTNEKDAIDGASFIFVVIPASGHNDLTRRFAPFLYKDQVVVLNPGRTGGCVEVINTLLELGLEKKEHPLVIETQSLFCACRTREDGIVDILSMKEGNVVAGIPHVRIGEKAQELSEIYGNLKVEENTLQTGLENMGALLHPAPVLLNTGWVESREVFFSHYYQAISPTISKYIEKMDEERIQIATAFGIHVRSLKRWHEEVYGCGGSSLYETLHANVAYASINAPNSLHHRYVTEEIPTGLVPLSELGRLVEVPTPFIDRIVDLGSTLLCTDFRTKGRNAVRLGLEGKSIDEIKEAFSS